MKRVILISRVSSDEQAKGYSLSTQEEALRAYCLKEGHQIVRVYREDHSAKNFNRPQFKKMLEEVKGSKGKVDLILFTTWCRFSRNLTESFAMIDRLRGYGIEVQAIEQPLDLSIPENLVLLAVFLALPDIDNTRRSMKITTGVRAAKKEGRWLGKAPFGYQNVPNEHLRMELRPSSQATLVKKAFGLIAKGKSQSEVRELLKKDGKYFSSTTLSELLRNRVYVGEVRIKNEGGGYYYVKGLHDALISTELFNQVQESLQGKLVAKGFIKAKSSKPKFPLRGQLVCGHCGGTLTASASKGRNGYHSYYHCNHCSKVRLRTAVVHEQIEAILSEIKLTKNAATLYKAMMAKLLQKTSAEKRRPLHLIEAEEAQYGRRIQNMEDEYADKKLDAETFAKTVQRYRGELNKLSREKSLASSEQTDYQRFLKSGLSLVDNLPALYQKASGDQKRDILGSIFPEKLQIKENDYRTGRVNEALLLILSLDKGLEHKKTGQPFKNLRLSGNVEVTGIEPVSKHIRRKLSTCLFSYCFSKEDRKETNQSSS